MVTLASDMVPQHQQSDILTEFFSYIQIRSYSGKETNSSDQTPYAVWSEVSSIPCSKR